MLEKILKRKDLERELKLPRSSIYAGMAKGTFPKPIKLEGNAVGWLEPEIIAWQKKRKAERDSPPATRKRRRRAAA